jgi:hypothetical protein
MKRRRQEETLSNPFPLDIWNIILDYARQFECRLASKTTVDGDIFLVEDQFFVVRNNLCLSWPQADISFDVSSKVRCKLAGVWWSKTKQQLEYWNRDGILQDLCKCEEEPFENWKKFFLPPKIKPSVFSMVGLSKCVLSKEATQ